MNILVLEDNPAPRALIVEYLDRRLHFHSFLPGPGRPDCYMNDDPEVHDSGCLGHIFPDGWGPHGPTDYSVKAPDADALWGLADELAKPDTDGAAIDRLCSFPDRRAADIMIVDLALSTDEETELKATGGNRRPFLLETEWTWDDPDDSGAHPLTCA